MKKTKILKWPAHQLSKSGIKEGEGTQLFHNQLWISLWEKLDDAEHEASLKCNLYESRRNPQLNVSEVDEFKQALRAINPKMGLAQLSSNNPVGIEDTKYGKSPSLAIK